MTTAKNAEKNNARKEAALKLAADFVASATIRRDFAVTMQNDSLKSKFDKLLNKFNSEQFALVIEKALKFKNADIQLATCAESLAVIRETDARFVAIYSAEKCVKALFAIAEKSANRCDNYTRSIARNLATLDKLNNKSALSAICSKIEFSSTDNVQSVKRFADCAVSTATTQCASTRCALAALSLVTVTKYAKDDVMTRADNALAKAFFAVFTADSADDSSDSEDAISES